MRPLMLCFAAVLAGSPLPAAGLQFGLPGAVKSSVGSLRASLTASAPQLPIAPASTATVTVTPGDTATATPTPSPTPSATPTSTSSATATPVLSATPTSTLTGTPSASPSASPTASPSASPTASPSASSSASPTRSATPSATRTITRTATRTPSFTATRTASPTAIPTLVAALGDGSNGLGSDGPAAGSPVSGVRGITGHNQNALIYFTDYGNNQLRVYNPTGASIYDAAFSRLTLASATVGRWGGLASGASGASLTTTPIQMYGPQAVVYDSYSQALYVSELNNNRVLVNFGTGTWFVAAGGGPCCALGDGGPASSARLSFPMGLGIQTGSVVPPPLYIADNGNNRIRSMATSSPYHITTVAGTGTAGYLGDGGQARLARLSNPRGVAVHSSGDLYIADTSNHVIRRVDGSGIISTIAGGGPSEAGYVNGVSTTARFDQPEQLHIDGDDLYVTEAGNNTVRRIELNNNYLVSTYAGGGLTNGPGAQPLNTELILPRGFSISGGRSWVGTEAYLYRFP